MHINTLILGFLLLVGEGLVCLQRLHSVKKKRRKKKEKNGRPGKSDGQEVSDIYILKKTKRHIYKLTTCLV